MPDKRLSSSASAIRRPCERCGTEFDTWPSEIRRGRGRFCSHSCSSLTKSGHGHGLLPRGESSSNWSGGEHRSRKGYIVVYVARGRYVPRCRLVAEQKIGRKLHPWEETHHLDLTKDNDDPDNLIVVSRSLHLRIHYWHKRLAWAAEHPGEPIEKPQNMRRTTRAKWYSSQVIPRQQPYRDRSAMP